MNTNYEIIQCRSCHYFATISVTFQDGSASNSDPRYCSPRLLTSNIPWSRWQSWFSGHSAEAGAHQAYLPRALLSRPPLRYSSVVVPPYSRTYLFTLMLSFTPQKATSRKHTQPLLLLPLSIFHRCSPAVHHDAEKTSVALLLSSVPGGKKRNTQLLSKPHA